MAAAIVVFAVWRCERFSGAATDASAEASHGTAMAPTPTRSSLNVAATPAPAAEPGPQERALDLAALRKALAGRPDAEAEEHRIVAFARFRDLVTAYGNGREQMPAAERMRLARQILSELPEHVARNEIVPVQAQAMTAALLTDAEPDPLTRSADLAASRRQWDAYANQTVGPSPAQDPRYQAYAQQSRAIFQEVQAAMPDSAEQQVVIAQRLQALRVQLFDHASSPDTH
ncbi:phospholipase C accessory protein PlcR [Trinickia dinghuensis]|uniref:Phospholipase C accessory protein PlcR n=2 Tax=Trinickia dinghuensis TaxID=2291023 RepID=A0A3D8JQH1_9BURK|nr:phospholipase C accessory protein PlcR [Trinickia dinghuensis]